MSKEYGSRRNFLKRISALGVMGTAAWLRSPGLLASSKSEGAGLKSQIQGNVMQRQDDDYENWRQAMMWHLSKPGRKPDMIVQAHSEEDVINAVNFSRKNNLKIALRSSGHNSTGSVLRDGGMLLDLSFMRDVTIDSDKQMASAQPALWNMQLINEAAKHDLAFPAAHCGSVALGGYLLGGGMGWNHAAWGGPACHSVLSMDIVTSDGKKVTASPEQNSDLYWAARGAGPGFFGVVTRFNLQLYQAPSSIFGSMYVHPLDNLGVATEALEKLVKIKDERVEILLLLMHNHQAPPDTPPEQSKICFVGANAFADSDEEAKLLLKPFAESELASKSVFKAEYQPSSFHKLYNPENVDTGLGRYAVDTDWTNDLSGALHAIADHFRSTPSPRSHFVGSLAMNTALHADASFSKIADHFIGSYLIWDDVADDEVNYAWLRQNHEILKPFSEGHYVNEVAGDLYPERYENCFTRESWKRLQTLRNRYDAKRVFHTYLGHS